MYETIWVCSNQRHCNFNFQRQGGSYVISPMLGCFNSCCSKKSFCLRKSQLRCFLPNPKFQSASLTVAEKVSAAIQQKSNFCQFIFFQMIAFVGWRQILVMTTPRWRRWRRDIGWLSTSTNLQTGYRARTELWNTQALGQCKLAAPVDQESSIEYTLSGAKGPALSARYPVSEMQ